MKVDIVLGYGAVMFALTCATDYESLMDAEFDWQYGEHSCDCGRSRLLTAVGALPEELPCNDNGDNQVRLLQLKPFVLH